MNRPKGNSDIQSRRKFTTSLAVTLAGVPLASSLVGCNQSPQSSNTSTPNPASKSALAKARRPLLVKSDPDRLLKGRSGQEHRLAIIESDDEINYEQPNRFPLMGSISNGIPVVYVKKIRQITEPLTHPRERDKSFPATVEVYSVDQNGKEVKVLSLVAVKQSAGSFICNVDITVKDNFKLGKYEGDGHLPYKYEVKADNMNQPYVSRVLILWGEAADIEHLEPSERKFNFGEFECLNIELDLHFCEENYCNCKEAQLLPRNK